jgi:hypothetical protein
MPDLSRAPRECQTYNQCIPRKISVSRAGYNGFCEVLKRIINLCLGILVTPYCFKLSITMLELLIAYGLSKHMVENGLHQYSCFVIRCSLKIDVKHTVSREMPNNA